MPNILSAGHKVASGAFLVQGITIGCMFSYGVFFNSLETELGWSRTLLSSCMSFAVLIMGVLAIGAGRLNDQFGPRWVIAGAGSCAGAGLMLMSIMTEPWQLFLFYGFMFGIGMSTHDVVTLSTIAKWFPNKRGFMSAVIKVGTASGQVCIPPIAGILIIGIGWRPSLIVIGVTAIFFLLIASWLIGQKIDQDHFESTENSSENGLTFAQARNGRVLWTLCAVQLSFFPALMTIPLHITAHGVDLGLSLAKATLVLSTIGGISIIGRLTIGLLIDKIGSRTSFLCCFIPLVISLIWIQYIDNPSYLFIFAIVYGFAHGGLFTVVSPTVADYFGTRAHGTIFGMILFFGTIGGSIGPIVAGSIYDSAGDYQLAFQILSFAALFGLILVLTLPAKNTTTE